MTTEAVRDVTLHEFGELPVRATVAFAVRCAQRIRPRFRPPEDLAAVDQALAVLDEILAMGRAFARGADGPYGRAEGLHQLAFNLGEATFAAHQMTPYALAHVAKAVVEGFALQGGGGSDTSATEVLAAAYGVSRVALTGGTGTRPGPAALQVVLKTLRTDMDRLQELALGRFAELGTPIDPSEDGPLGPLWPHGTPAWL